MEKRERERERKKERERKRQKTEMRPERPNSDTESMTERGERREIQIQRSNTAICHKKDMCA